MEHLPRPTPHTARFARSSAAGLSQAQLERFERDGFLAGLEVLGPADVAELRERLGAIGERIEELEPRLYEVESAWRERPQEVVLHFLGVWLVDELFHDLIFHPAVTLPIAQVLGTRRLRFWHDQVFWKPAGHPGVVPWHQDYSYWERTGPPAHATMFIPLDDMNESSGALEFVPGSHEWGLLPQQDFGGRRDALLAQLADEQREAFVPQPVTLRAGQGSIHHSHTVHGSGANTGERPRRAIVLNYMADGTRVTDDSGPLLRGVPTIRRGDPVGGPHFPLVLDLDSVPRP